MAGVVCVCMVGYVHTFETQGSDDENEKRSKTLPSKTVGQKDRNGMKG